MNSEQQNLSRKFAAVYKQEAELYKKAGFKKEWYIEFVGKKKIPFLSKIALKIINFQGGSPAVKVKDLNKK